ncbi:uncharacterized protein SETTUDRAFT_167326 [Exserohilum turcica Et28A]|uniref:Uncharacterized protein n=1 Tax=Exserohilum turcicum (strain 28A) TaxID=671987 RepID=R0KRP1_EXST2|nr:uncharacterized protein SETTUDRAFT_167326 [Exserohilum turcica Et28A]EOA90492.1 hypothetical protein SETTUDRAFT_167326 [Exserohilum turcica Et28A]
MNYALKFLVSSGKGDRGADEGATYLFCWPLSSLQHGSYNNLRGKSQAAFNRAAV